MEVPFLIHNENNIPSIISRGKDDGIKPQKPRRALGELSKSSINVRAASNQSPAFFGKSSSQRSDDGLAKKIFIEKQSISKSNIPSTKHNITQSLTAEEITPQDEEMMTTRFTADEDPYDKMLRQAKSIHSQILPSKVKSKPLQGDLVDLAAFSSRSSFDEDMMHLALPSRDTEETEGLDLSMFPYPFRCSDDILDDL